jgi:Putative Ig domain
MGGSVSSFLQRSRLALLAAALALLNAACSGVGVSQGSGSDGTSGPSSVSNPGNANSELVISGTPPASVVAGHAYAFTPSATAPDGTSLSFTAANLPPWATFDSTSGQLSGTPSLANVGTFANIQITVSDGQSSAALPTFSITVLASSSSSSQLTISGNPPTQVVAGKPYSFKPATDAAGGAALTFSIQNKPKWATFSTSNGLLAGTPTTGETGTYANIAISVSNGEQTADLAAFSVTVTKSGSGTSTGNVTLSWTPVTQNTNGSAATDLAGYEVHYGSSPSAMNTVVTLANPSTTSYTVASLASGTWYFGITAYTSAGVQSALSNIGQATIP